MFGFLRPTAWNREYRQAYARCCQFQHLHFGTRSLPFLSYEGVLLYQLSADTGLISGPPAETRTCCRLQTDRASLQAEDAKVGRFCAAVGLLLAGIKLDDDIRDDNSWTARCARWWLRRPLSRAWALFEALDGGFRERVTRIVAEHLALESSGQTIDIDRYAEPTAEAFGHVFGLLPVFTGNESAVPLFTKIGRHIGAAIIAFDCAADWDRDRRKQRFNPLPDAASTEIALAKSAAYLAQALGLCQQAFGDRSRSGWLLQSAFYRIPHRTPRHSWRTRFQAWGLMREPGYVTARLDCCDCGAIDCCGGIDGGAECCGGAGCCASGGIGLCCCPCDCGVPFLDNSLCRRNAPPTRTASPVDAEMGESGNSAAPSLVGRKGFVESTLKPWGTAIIGGQRYPAQSEGRWIDTGTEVTVVRETGQGLLVRAID